VSTNRIFLTVSFSFSIDSSIKKPPFGYKAKGGSNSLTGDILPSEKHLSIHDIRLIALMDVAFGGGVESATGQSCAWRSTRILFKVRAGAPEEVNKNETSGIEV
jgi:hypothetical protein